MEKIYVSSFPAFLTSLEATMILLAIPMISKDMHVSDFYSSIILTAYVLTVSALYMPFSKIFETKGSKLGLIVGMFILFIGSITAFLSYSFEILIFARIIQGIGAAIVSPLSLSYAASLYDDNKRGRAIGINHTLVSLGYVLGLPIGGLVAYIDWKFLFLLTAIATVISFPFLFKLPDIKGISKITRGSFFFALILSGLLLILYLPVVGIMITIVGIVAFISEKRRFPHGFVSGSMSGMAHSVTRNAVASFLVFSYFSLSFSSVVVGFLVLIFPAFFTIVALASGKLADKYGYTMVSIIGFSVMALSSYFLTIGGMVALIIASFALGIASGASTTSNTAFTMNSLTKSDRILGSGLRTLQGTVSMAIGLSFSSLFFLKVGDIAELVFLSNIAAALILMVDFFFFREKSKEHTHVS